MSYAGRRRSHLGSWPDMCIGCGTTSSLREYNPQIIVSWSMIPGLSGGGFTTWTPTKEQLSANLCPSCLEKSNSWAKHEKERYTTITRISVLFMVLAIFPLSSFGWTHGTEIMISFVLVLLGTMTGPLYHRSAQKTFSWILEEPYYAYTRFFPRSPGFSFMFRDPVYFTAFSEVNPDLHAFQRGDLRPTVGFPMGLVWLALGLLIIIFMGLGMEITLNIAIRWILAILVSLLPIYLIGESDVFAGGPVKTEKVETEEEDDTDWL